MPRRVPVRLLPGCRGRVPVGVLRSVARHVLDAEGVAPRVEVDVVLADAATVQDLNRLYRGKNEPTDVLSFASSEGDIAFPDSPDETPSLGEVIVCLPVAEEQASRGKRAVAGEVAHLLVHGLLHILGYDHEDAADAPVMQAREDALLAELGYEGQYEHGAH